MKIQEIINMINPDEFDEDKYQKLKNLKSSLSNSDKKFLNKFFSSAKCISKEEVLKAFICYAMWCPDEAVESARKKGVFRYKVFGIRGKNRANYYLSYLVKNSEMFGFSTSSLSYLVKKKNCAWFETLYCKSEKKIDELILNHYNKRIRKKLKDVSVESSLHKELLAYIDMLFLIRLVQQNKVNFNDLNSYSREEIAEGVSYLIFKYIDKFGLKPERNYIVDAQYIISTEIEKLILLACQINYLLELELLIDFYNYDVLIDENDIRIKCKDESLEKSIRLGFVKQEMQEILFYGNCEIDNQSICLAQLSDFVIEKSKDIIVKQSNGGIASRYIFTIPTAMIELIAEQKESGKVSLFQEEALEIQYFMKEMHMSSDEFFEKKITKHCTIYDIILCQRLFRFIFYMQKKVYDSEENVKVVLQSLIPVMSKEMLVKYFTIFLKDEIKAEEIYTLLEYKSAYKLDIQYTPFLRNGKKVIYPISVLAQSNLLRNAIAYSHLSKNEIVNDDSMEPLVRFCKEAFERCSYEYKIFTNMKYSYKGQKGEIDVLVVSDEDIILIECKDPLMPTSNFEMRATFEHIEKASKQLDISKEAFEDDGFRKKYFADNLKINGRKRRICTSIILGNRLFSIWSGAKHPIRYANELEMILTNGIISSPFTKWSIWKGEQYSHEDLIDYFNNEGLFNTIMKESMDRYDNFLTLYGKKIRYESYLWNMEKLYLLCDKRLRIVEKDEEEWKKFVEACKCRRNNTI